MKEYRLETGKIHNSKSRFTVVAAVWLALAAMAALAVTATQARAQAPSEDSADKVHFQPFTAIGYQANSSSPLVFSGDPIGKNAVWQLQVGPLESSSFASIPGASDPSQFAGANVVADYSQAQIVTSDGSTLRVSVYGVRFDDTDPTGKDLAGAASTNPHHKSGVYSVTGGTGVFENTGGGTGSISFDAPGDGRVFVSLNGAIECFPTGPIRSCKVKP